MMRGVPSHWKFDALRETLGLARYEAVGILETLWWWTGEFRDGGRLEGMGDEQIAIAIGWRGDAHQLLRALVSARWVDVDDGCYVVHDWEDWAPEYVKDRRRKRRERAENREQRRRVRDNRGQSADSPKASAIDKTRQDETKSPSDSLARAARKNERAMDTETGAVPAAVTEAQSIRVAALGETKRLSDAEARTLRGYIAECFKRGAVPAFLVQWRGFHADDFALSRGCPVSLFLTEPSKYALRPAPKASADEKRRAVGRPSSDWRVCECGHPAARYHDGGRCKATSCGCEAFRESAEEVTA